MRTPNGAALALLARMATGERIGWAQLVQMDLSTTLRLTTAGRDVTWDGNTYLRGGMGTIEAIEDGVGDLQGLRFVLPGIRSSDLVIALTEPVEGKRVRVWDAIVDPDTGQVADAALAWSGTLNVPDLADGPSAVISVTAEHRGILAVRPKPRRYTDAEQQRRYPGDTSLNFDPATDAAPLAWPKASFFKK